jgi:hypothetical protein
VKHVQQEAHRGIGEHVFSERGVANRDQDVRERNSADRQNLAGEMLTGSHVMAFGEFLDEIVRLRDFHRLGPGLATALDGVASAP